MGRQLGQAVTFEDLRALVTAGTFEEKYAFTETTRILAKKSEIEDRVNITPISDGISNRAVRYEELIPIISCGVSNTYSGAEAYPSEATIVLGSSLGNVTLTYDAFGIPDKFIVIFDGVEVINTGYRGDITQQAALDAALAERGLPPEPIVGTGVGTASFTKTTSITTAIVRVYAPIATTAWNYTLGCPA